MAGEGLSRVGAELLNPFAQHILMNVQVSGSLCRRYPRSLTSFTASILNSRLNFRLRMTHLRLHETPKLGVHQTGSSSKRYVALGEGTHTIVMEKNRLKLFEAVQAFFDEGRKD